ncbi:anti-sigma factor [Bacillus smithii]|uniref:anti-sigma factor n=1 Tax=Bacillus smithii TaxID=1479 RepID=UPI0030C9CDC3
MNADCQKEITRYMHEYLDGELPKEQVVKLREHLQQCQGCHQHFQELKQSIMFVRGLSNSVKAPEHFTENVLSLLPKEKRTIKLQRWFHLHPFLTACAIFFVFMMGSFVALWEQDQQFSFTKQPNLVVKGNTVIVPKGKTVKGDLVVRNGDIRIEGEVDGDVTVINGEKYMASAGKVTGNIQEIHQMFEWLWFHMKELVAQ